MQFIYILTLNQQYYDLANWTAATNQTMEAHFNYLKTLFEEGTMKHVGRTDMPFGNEDLKGFAIFETENEQSANEIMNSDPAVCNGLMSAKLLPYKIVFTK
jgi:uncharacterized protein YciI